MADTTTAAPATPAPAAAPATPAAPAPAAAPAAPDKSAQIAADLAKPSLLSTDKPAETPPAEAKPPETKPAEAKPGDKAAPAEIKIEDIKLPEGIEMDKEAMTELTGMAKEFGLDTAKVQKLVDFEMARIKPMLEAPYKIWADTQKEWQAKAKADPEYGGEAFGENLGLVQRLLTPHSSDNPNPFIRTADEAKAVRDALNATGAGNQPEIVRMFVRMAKHHFAPGSAVVGRGPANIKPPAELLYPNQGKDT